MEAHSEALQQKLQRLLAEAAEAAGALDREAGRFSGVPHYLEVELRAHELARQFSQQIQQYQLRETAATQPLHADCPTCQRRCQLQPQQRTIQTIDGDVELTELAGHCTGCRRTFFPASTPDGAASTPGLARRRAQGHRGRRRDA